MHGRASDYLCSRVRDGGQINLYSFALPSSMVISQDLSGKQRSLPAEEAQGGYNAIARPQEP